MRAPWTVGRVLETLCFAGLGAACGTSVSWALLGVIMLHRVALDAHALPAWWGEWLVAGFWLGAIAGARFGVLATAAYPRPPGGAA